MRRFGTRATQTLHVGAKEYTPNGKQQLVMKAKRVWMQDNGIEREHTEALLPELFFANSILKQVSELSFDLKMKVESKYRLSETCFTRAAVNCTNCGIHRDFCVGLDVLMYSGKWSKGGGQLVVPQLGIKITIQAGDVIVLDSGLFHCVTSFEGTRFVVVFFTKTHNEKSKAGNELVVTQ